MIDGLEVDIIEKIKMVREINEEVVRVVEKMKKAVVRSNKWQIDEDLVLIKGKVYVLKDEKLRLEIIQLHHDMLVARYEER